ncbi:MAG: flagellar hook-basal body protein [Defluviitaleaceae bacterium]|nr:flagellar hook-basal body protein [Defluviitaleaceae bacterium]
MMRSLWTGASGMGAQQMATDTIANNISNVNTTGFKRERLEFQSLLYQTMQGAGQNPAVVGNNPANLQVGHGVRAVASTRSFSIGTLEPTGRNVDFAIQGTGFFTVDTGFGNHAFTRDGSFNLSPIGGGELALVTQQGYFVLDNNGQQITFDSNLDLQHLTITQFGNFSARNSNGEPVDIGVQLGIAQFSNRQGLEAAAGNLFLETAASGTPILETAGDVAQRSQIIQGHLERSNVNIAEEMVGLIVSQRAFELNSRVIQTSDEMLQQVSQLRR